MDHREIWILLQLRRAVEESLQNGRTIEHPAAVKHEVPKPSMNNQMQHKRCDHNEAFHE
jgi:hypothetical protein